MQSIHTSFTTPIPCPKSSCAQKAALWNNKDLTHAMLLGKELLNGKASNTAAVAVAAPDRTVEGELACSENVFHPALALSNHSPPTSVCKVCHCCWLSKKQGTVELIQDLRTHLAGVSAGFEMLLFVCVLCPDSPEP